jgi:hypothetical protein
VIPDDNDSDDDDNPLPILGPRIDDNDSDDDNDASVHHVIADGEEEDDRLYDGDGGPS